MFRSVCALAAEIASLSIFVAMVGLWAMAFGVV